MISYAVGLTVTRQCSSAHGIMNIHNVIIIDTLIAPTYIEIPEINSDVVATAYSNRNRQLLGLASLSFVA